MPEDCVGGRRHRSSGLQRPLSSVCKPPHDVVLELVHVPARDVVVLSERLSEMSKEEAAVVKNGLPAFLGICIGKFSIPPIYFCLRRSAFQRIAKVIGGGNEQPLVFSHPFEARKIHVAPERNARRFGLWKRRMAWRAGHDGNLSRHCSTKGRV